MCDLTLKIELKKQLEIIMRNFPTMIISERIVSLNLINKIEINLGQS